MRAVLPIAVVFVAMVILGTVFFEKVVYYAEPSSVQPVPAVPVLQDAPEIPVTSPAPEKQSDASHPDEFVSPLERSGERVTKKPFGIFITRQNLPVQPGRFSGYHTGTDFEIFPEELAADVTVRAVCDGTLLVKQYASGYGGVAVQSCVLEGEPITVVYGHLRLASIAAPQGAPLRAGDTLGVLGADKSVETDGERKHLHLGFHQGSAVTLLGYVADQSQLRQWIDPCQYVCS